MQIAIIAVPYDLGRHHLGHGKGPERLISSGLERSLKERGHTVEQVTIGYDPTPRLTETQSAFRLNAMLSSAVAEAIARGRFPLILAGNCMTALGTLSGIGKRDTGILWLDAHADFNTPETTESGYLDGMALSVACGRCWKNLAAQDPRYCPIPADQVVLVGTRDIDAAEAQLLDQSHVKMIGTAQLRQARYQVPKPSQPAVSDIYLHLDADVLDAEIGPANGFASAEGLYPDEVVQLFSWTAENYSISALATTAFSPDHDTTGTVCKALKYIIIGCVSAIDKTKACVADR